MTDELEIRGGGVVAVDTATLRHAAGEADAIAASCEEVAEALHRTVGTAGHVVEASLVQIGARTADDLREEARALGRGLRRMADRYEYVELVAARAAAAAAGDTALARVLSARIDELRDQSPGVALHATTLVAQWEWERQVELATQTVEAGATLGPAAWGAISSGLGALLLVRALGYGAPVKPPTGVPHAVSVGAVRSGPTSAPASLVAIAERMPGKDAGRVRVERYTMPDRSQQFAVYIAGTKRMAPGVSPEPWDLISNRELYTGTRSASLDATERALVAAGAKPGDVVHMIGYSQGAMIATNLALTETYEVPTLITFGSPVQGDVGAGTLSVAVRHSDDLVSALSAGGLPVTAGSPESFVAERVVDPEGSVRDLPLGPHSLDLYTQTAAMLDASSDPRMDPVRAVLAEPKGAASVEATVYTAVRGSLGNAGGTGGRVSAF